MTETKNTTHNPSILEILLYVTRAFRYIVINMKLDNLNYYIVHLNILTKNKSNVHLINILS